MGYLIGIDGGGSKTKLMCFDESGRLLSETAVGTTYYRQIGVEGVIKTLKKALGELGIDLRGSLIGFGMPAFGENKEDAKAVFDIQKAFPDLTIHFENDVYCAWAGATDFSPGSIIECGTGAMSVGRDRSGRFARSGGWGEFFSDEGSGYWLGKKALEIFSKESDCRLPKGALYRLMRERLNLKDDFDIIDIIDSEYADYREKIAGIQMVLLEAQKLGDKAATEAYAQAVREVTLIALGTLRQLDFGSGTVDISYVGGLFNEKELFLHPFITEINKHCKANVHPPKLSPCHGALLFALEKFDKEKFEEIKRKWL